MLIMFSDWTKNYKKAFQLNNSSPVIKTCSSDHRWVLDKENISSKHLKVSSTRHSHFLSYKRETTFEIQGCPFLWFIQSNLWFLRYRELQATSDARAMELSGEAKLKSFEAERSNMIQEETQRNLKQAQVDCDKLQKKLEVKCAGVMWLESMFVTKGLIVTKWYTNVNTQVYIYQLMSIQNWNWTSYWTREI